MSKRTKATEAQAIEEEALQATAETQEETAATEPAAAQQPEPVVYLGPTIEHVVAYGTVFTDGLPEALAAKTAAEPFLNGLIFPVSEYAAKAALIATKGTALNTLFRKAAEK